MLRVTALQTRTLTPNHYLFRDFSSAIQNSKRTTEFQASISGFNGPRFFADVLICFGGEEFRTPFNITQLAYAEKSVAWFTEDPYEINANLKNQGFFDHVLTTDEKSSAQYTVDSSVFPLATPKKLFDNTSESNKEFDLFLFGSLWPNRISILEQIVSNIGITKYRVLLITSQFDSSWVDQKRVKEIFSIIEKHKGRIIINRRPFSLRQLKHFAQISKVCINWPRKFAKDSWSVPGPRIFEIAASGTIQFIDLEIQPGVKNLIPQGSYVQYNVDSLDDTLRSYLIDSEIPKDSGQQLFEYARENHTWDKRVSEILDLCENELCK
jgi:spore maturation protein CgeB